MIKNLKVTNPQGGELLLDLINSGEEEGLAIFNIEGLGPPKATINAVGGAYIDGKSVTNTPVDARHIVLTLAVTWMGDDEEIAKQKIYDFFPIKQQITFEIETDTKKVYTMAYVESMEFNQFAKIENAVISLYCPYPYFLNFYNEELLDIEITGETIQYSGNIPIGMLITISISGTGSVSDITITNSNGSQSMTLDVHPALTNAGGDSSTSVAGDIVYIDTRRGQKSITWFQPDASPPPPGYYYDVLNMIGTSDDWIQLINGDNEIVVSSASSGRFTVDIEYTSIVEGV